MDYSEVRDESMWEDDTLCIDYMNIDGTSITVTAKPRNIVIEATLLQFGTAVMQETGFNAF